MFFYWKKHSKHLWAGFRYCPVRSDPSSWWPFKSIVCGIRARRVDTCFANFPLNIYAPELQYNQQKYIKRSIVQIAKSFVKVLYGFKILAWSYVSFGLVDGMIAWFNAWFIERGYWFVGCFWWFDGSYLVALFEIIHRYFFGRD